MLLGAFGQHRENLARLLILTIIGVGLSLWVIACSLDIVRCASQSEGVTVPIEGFVAFVWGWMMPGHVGWWANLTVVASWTLSLVVRRETAILSICYGILGVVLGSISYYTLSRWPPTPEFHGGPWEFVEFGPGIHVWMISISSGVLTGVISLAAAFRRSATTGRTGSG